MWFQHSQVELRIFVTHIPFNLSISQRRRNIKEKLNFRCFQFGKIFSKLFFVWCRKSSNVWNPCCYFSFSMESARWFRFRNHWTANLDSMKSSDLCVWKKSKALGTHKVHVVAVYLLWKYILQIFVYTQLTPLLRFPLLSIFVECKKFSVVKKKTFSLPQRKTHIVIHLMVKAHPKQQSQRAFLPSQTVSRWR